MRQSLFERVFSPQRIGSIEAPNRLFSSAHDPMMTQGGVWSDQHVRYYEAKASGGLGLIVTGAAQISPEGGAGVGRGNELTYVDGAAAAYRRGTDAVHSHGVPILLQLWHGGRSGGITTESMTRLFAPSAEPCSIVGEVPQVMEIEDIKKTVNDFVNAAVVAREGGFDGVELHGAHGYLFTQFISPFFNTRTDEYGGALENRLRFASEVISGIRGAVGREFVLGYKLSAEENFTGGLTAEDNLEIARRLEALGLLDYIAVSAGTYLSMPTVIPPMYSPLALNAHAASVVKAAVNLPVMAIGRIKEIQQAEDILEQGQADMVAMTRALLCDSELPKKARSGRLAEVRNCIACNQKCWGNLMVGAPISCTLNPAAGRENEPFWSTLQTVTRPKKVVVVGGGPAGCEAARVMAERGHDVTIYERGAEFGGQLLTALKASGRREWEDVGRYYTRELGRLGVCSRFGVEVTLNEILQAKPDAVVVATGSRPRMTPYSHLPVIDVAEGGVLTDVRGVLDRRVAVGTVVAVYCGENHFQGVTLAETLLEQGKAVEVITPDLAPASGALAEGLTWETVITRLYKRGVQNIRVFSAVTHFDGGRLRGVNVLNDAPFEIACDTLVMAFGGIADDRLYHELKGRVPELHRIGDCAAPRRAEYAIYEGGKIGRTV